MVLPIITVLSIANKDESLKLRYRIFRDTMRGVDPVRDPFQRVTDTSTSTVTTPNSPGGRLTK